MPKRVLKEADAVKMALAPVEKQPLYTAAGKESGRFGIILDPEGEQVPVGVVSEDYKLLPNRIAYDTALDVLRRSEVEFEPATATFDGKRYRQRWLLPEFAVQPAVGDIVQCGLDVVNSYDGSTQFGLSFIARVLKCTNWMMVDFVLGAVKFRHWQNGKKEWEGELSQAVDYFAQLGSQSEKLIPHINDMVGEAIDRPAIQTVFKEMETPDHLLANVYRELDGDTMWDLYNAFTKVLSNKDTIRSDNLNRHISQYFFGIQN